MEFDLKRKQGFTLIEILVAVGLMALIMVIVATIFRQTSRLYSEGGDRMTIYLNARNTLDQLEVDLLGCLPMDIGLQKFSLAEGRCLDENRVEGTADSDTVADKMTLRSFTSAGGTFQAVEVQYVMGKETDPTILAETGGTGKTLKTKRQLYAIYRKPYLLDKNGNATSLIGDPKLDPKDREASMALCHYVLAFRLEYFDTTMRQFREISDHLKDQSPKDIFEWPIGDGNPSGEQLHRGIRAILRVVANAAERQERIFPRIVWIPVGY